MFFLFLPSFDEDCRLSWSISSVDNLFKSDDVAIKYESILELKTFDVDDDDGHVIGAKNFEFERELKWYDTREMDDKILL